MLAPATPSAGTLSPRLKAARLLALLAPAGLLAGAYIGELGYGLYPCEMCWWQRWPHFAAVGLAAVAFIVPRPRLWIALAALAVLMSGVIGGFHAGVEYDWWEGITGCAAIPSASGASPLDSIISTPLVRCDRAPWSLLGVSLAGWNFLVSVAAGLTILWLLQERRV